MNDIAIKVENLSKAFIIGLKETKSENLLGALSSFIKSPVTNFKKINRLGNLKSDVNADDIFWALRDINFEIKKGDAVGIIGKNGAGKSTLLKILSQITYPTTGNITIDGKVASLLEVGTGFNEELTGKENIYLNGTILGMSKKEIDRKFGEIVEFSGVEKFIETPVKRYSSGMRVRLAFAVAAHLDPEILIIDEVLAVGDADFQKKCLGKMEELTGKEHRTILFVSHNMAAVRSFCNKAIVLNDGRIIFSGSIAESISYYTGQANFQSENDLFYDVKLNNGQEIFTDKPFKITFKCRKLRTGQKGYVFLIIKDSDNLIILHKRERLEKLNKSENDFIEITVNALNVRAGSYSYHIKVLLEEVDNKNARFISDDRFLDIVNQNNSDLADSLGLIISETIWR